MKVLFAVSNDAVSESIIKKYQQMYKEIITSKNVYYFNAILKELQKDKSYDRVVISEDLEPFTNNNYDAIDNFIFERLDNISDEATTLSGDDIPIILIATDRRTKSDNLLVKLFGIGVYSALLGQDRSIEEVCYLINKPRTKKEAKVYYKIDSSEVGYRPENEEDVSEQEIQNILTHYKRLGKNEDRYVDSFDNIASQYTDQQLKVIIKFLPLNVKAVLEANSPKYQQLISFNTANKKTFNGKIRQNNTNKAIDNNGIKIESIGGNEPKLTKPVIIPSMNTSRKVEEVRPQQDSNIIEKMDKIDQKLDSNMNDNYDDEINELNNDADELYENDNFDDLDEFVNTLPGNETEEEIEEVPVEEVIEEPKRGRGRPRKIKDESAIELENQPKRGRGRPKKVVAVEPEDVEDVTENEDVQSDSNDDEDLLPGFEQIDTLDEDFDFMDNWDDEDLNELPGVDDEEEEENQDDEDLNELPGIEEDDTDEADDYEDDEEDDEFNISGIQELDEEDNEDNNELPQVDEDDDDLSGINDLLDEEDYEEYNEDAKLPEVEEDDNTPFDMMDEEEEQDWQSDNYENISENNNEKEIQSYTPTSVNLESLITKDKKIVSFVGTSKNGTSFLVNNIADMLSKQGIKTAILDLTKNRNAYYIYTKNEENLRKIAFSSIEKLSRGVAEGIRVNNNLDVYTSLPGENNNIGEYGKILETLLRNYSLVLLDCDFNSEYGYLKESQEIYLVQSMDVLTIQPLTAYLRDLKAKQILDPNKLRIVINKYTKIRGVTEKVIIGGMAFYNDPAMSFMTELFNRETIKYSVIPFDVQTYSRYLEDLVNCNISVNGYQKDFIAALRKLANMVYPLITGGNNYKINNKYGANSFSNDMNSTLDKMKQNY